MAPISAAPRPASLRDALRARTAMHHALLERTPLMRRISDGIPSEADYVDYLRAQWALHARLEPAVAPWVSAFDRSTRLVKTGWLAADLSALGQDVPPDAAVRTNMPGRGAALGTLYVLEGATLGLHQVRRRLPGAHPAVMTGGRFMSAYGAHTGPLWTAFLEELERLPVAEWNDAGEAAERVFQQFIDAFASRTPS